MASLGTELPKEMARVRDKLMPRYMAIGSAGSFALFMMRAELDRATKALANGDVLEIMRSYEALKGFKD